MFRRLIIEANLGASQQLTIPYRSTQLPLQKLWSLVYQYVEESENNADIDLDELPQTPLFQEMLEASIAIDSLLRMTKLRSLNQEIKEFRQEEEENETKRDIMEEEGLPSSESSEDNNLHENDEDSEIESK